MSKPEWSEPIGTKTKLRLKNSLTREIENFTTGENSLDVKVYTCGPTVYDASHLGHARTYITFDVLRQILTEYCDLHPIWAMNITDIDDKIITKARRNFLYQDFRSKTHFLDETVDIIKKAMEWYAEMLTARSSDIDKLKSHSKTDELTKLKNDTEKLHTLTRVMTVDGYSFDDAIQCSYDIVSEYLDHLWLTSDHHSRVKLDSGIFSDTAQYWEKEFFRDMDALGVTRPNMVCRVTDYMPEIIEYIEIIIKNGYAYVSEDGSVYFSISDFEKNPKNKYAKLYWEAGNSNEDSNDSSESSESDGDGGGGKRHPKDFAMWKKAKDGEPSWDSPWGYGRPGWHIECNALSNEMLGDTIDIHCGGIDLRFPHHDNEIAQADAYNDDEMPWVNYFVHSGHLLIDGLKMSKSLKNFITVKDALKKYTPYQLRLFFLLHDWTEPINYSEEVMSFVCDWEKRFKEFFMNVEAIVRENKNNLYLTQACELLRRLESCRKDVDESICENMNTKRVLECLRQMLDYSNTYIHEAKEDANPMALTFIGKYFTRIFKLFGLVDSSCDMGLGQTGSDGDSGSDDKKYELAKAFAEFRDIVRKNAIKNKNEELLEACDAVRDQVLPELGVRLEDKRGGTIIKLLKN